MIASAITMDARSTPRYLPKKTRTSEISRSTTAHAVKPPGSARMTAELAAPAIPVMVAAATRVWGSAMSQTPQFSGPGRLRTPEGATSRSRLHTTRSRGQGAF